MDDDALSAALVAAVRQLFQGPNRDQLSVNNVRKQVEEEHGLETGFFAGLEWKSRSKTLIKETVEELEAAETTSAAAPSSQITPPEEEAPKVKKAQKNGTKAKPAPKKVAPKKPAPKKKAAPPKKKKKHQSDDEDEDEESDLSELSEPSPTEDEESEAEISEEEVKPKKGKAPAKKQKKPKDESEESELSDLSEEEVKPKKKAPPKKGKPAAARGQKRKAAESDAEEVADEITISTSAAPVDKEASPSPSETKTEVAGFKSTATAPKDDDSSELSSVIDDDPPPKKKRKSKSAEPKPAPQKADNAADSSSELSSVIDDAPPPKKRKSKGAAAAPKSTGEKKPRGKAVGEDISPDEAEIKKLQGHLVKCGVRKIWAFELKKYGDDTKAKIRHLRDALRDVGMDGRFSESKAREIKERRELAKELEAVEEFGNLWGGAEGRRARRGAAPRKSLKEDSGDEEDEDGEGDGFGKGKKKKSADDGDGEEKDEEDEDGSDDGPKANARRRKARPELAFLGSDDSDSDD
ncbi:hypothetical protein N0V93_008237 [Gnomoniopsis smithogilvyi]|uniref:Transcriptional regulator n=1 Tax=Gnomoniopsis smithogilvyi TaxID=1191159 RepID=A0A9W8YPN6_9PEZI|nr:hypothetical protein N0V93_008237 [Gnomoniopsis smithogilvyi]